jgi:D-alanine--poly(phosphoribitol) ligase subunit 1
VALKYIYNLGLSFYNIAEEFFSNTALRFPGSKEYSYTELNSFSNQLAHFLIECNIPKESVIAIFNNKSFFGYSLMLACLKTGIIYTNLDATNPWQRISKILDNCSPVAIFHEETSEEIIRNINKDYPAITTYCISEKKLFDKISLLSNKNLESTNYIQGNHPAYIMFTSGSTGFPKGAVMSHNNLLNFINWGQQTFSVTANDVFTNANPIYFDNSVFDFYTSLFSGATLVPLDSDIVKNPKSLIQAINNAKCTIWFSVPSLLVYLLTTKALTKNDFQTVKKISFGGEGFAKARLKQLYNLFSSRITLYNVYGPTECTCICSSYVINDTDFDNMTELAPLGNIATNFGYEILPVEDIAIPNMGELALSGPCVGLGYYNDTERTSRAFIQMPGKKYHARIYRTGDLVLKENNGYLYFKGRIDNQVKHMGYRIELEEIEAAFNSLPYITEVGVIYEKVSPELGQIRAFVCVNDNRVTMETLQIAVKNILPIYMIPKNITILESLPKNRNGKIDRKQLIAL